MSRVVLHIGTHKTATTTIQDMLQHNSALLADHDVIYPRLGRASGHHGLVPAWAAMPQVYQLPRGPMGTLADLARAHAESERTLVLSSEEFSRSQSLAEMGRIREALSAFDRVEVICALRPQWQYLQSIYLEMSKKRRVAGPPRFVKSVLETGRFRTLWLDYNGLLDQLEENFAPDEITLLDFVTCRNREGGILGAFLRHLDAGIDVEQLAQINNGQSNVSSLSLAQWAANVLADPEVPPRWLVEKSSTLLKSRYGAEVNPCLFTRREFNQIMNRFTEPNARLNARRHDVQPDFSLSAPDPDSLTLFRDNIDAKFWINMNRLLLKERASLA